MKTHTLIKSSLICLLSLSTSAFADEQINWTGFYSSAMIGRDWGDVGEGNGLAGNTSYTGIISKGIGSSIQGWASSLKLGYNKQFDNNLIGIELGGTWQNAKSGKESPDTYQQNVPVSTPAYPDPGASITTAKTKVNTYETLAPRLGHIFNDTTLVYVSGGAALGQIKRTIYDNGNWFNTGTVISDSKTELGYVLGFGAEYKLNDKWALRGNYEYVDFGKINTNYNGSDGLPAFYKQANSVHFSNLSAGVSYAF
jgi:outer membrane immunogenic protein